ncbi:MAG: rhomboid family intramembrane serine protease [Clostridia bacterium]|nr:rhomboid family intramembrane serine protease [Clostridia bacterium]
MKKIQYNSPVILTYVLLCLGALILSILTAGRSNRLLFCVYRSSLADPLTYVRLFGHVLGHSGWQHFFNNALYLLIVGPAVEERYGSRNLLVAMLVTAFVSGAVHCVLSPGAGLLGASGIVFMLIFLASLSGMKNGCIPLTLILVAVLYLGQEVYGALFLNDGVSHLGHIIGGVCGTVLGFGMRKSGRK